ncbi:MAG: hypothetical protein L3J81_00305, partial [Thermoplasmata archaeon]|nr:hypothetical protein [Thermoplasmata archaeon]
GLLACAVEVCAAVLGGLDLSARGLPGWEGTFGIALGAIGAVGFVVLLPRVDFVGDLAVIRFGSGVPKPNPTPGSSPAEPGPSFEVWSAVARSRNWEVLGDRGGRRVVVATATNGSGDRSRELAAALAGTPSAEAGTNLPAGFK